MEIARDVYSITDEFPKRETYGMSSQVQRSAVSIPANIAEGHAKNSTKDYLRHISIAQGSLAETETHLLLATSLAYTRPERITQVLNKCAERRRMLSGLRRSLRVKLQS
jgi:four helix bundle protein